MTSVLARLLILLLPCMSAHAVGPVGAPGEPATLSAPEGLTATPSPTGKEIVLTWQPVPGAREYWVYVTPPPAAQAGGRPSVVGASGTRFIITVPPSTAPGTVYRASVEAVGLRGIKSERVDFPPTPVQGAQGPLEMPPVSVIARETGVGQVTVTWSGGPSGARYAVFRKIGSAAMISLCDPCSSPFIDRGAHPSPGKYTYYVSAKEPSASLPTLFAAAPIDVKTGQAGTMSTSGQACPAGKFVTGFDSAGGLLCASP